MSMRALLKLLRPHQWLKSGFVFVGLLFGHAWSDPSLVREVTLAAVAFSLAASAIYAVLVVRRRWLLQDLRRIELAIAGAEG